MKAAFGRPVLQGRNPQQVVAIGKKTLAAILRSIDVSVKRIQQSCALAAPEDMDLLRQTVVLVHEYCAIAVGGSQFKNFHAAGFQDFILERLMLAQNKPSKQFRAQWKKGAYFSYACCLLSVPMARRSGVYFIVTGSCTLSQEDELTKIGIASTSQFISLSDVSAGAQHPLTQLQNFLRDDQSKRSETEMARYDHAVKYLDGVVEKRESIERIVEMMRVAEVEAGEQGRGISKSAVAAALGITLPDLDKLIELAARLGHTIKFQRAPKRIRTESYRLTNEARKLVHDWAKIRGESPTKALNAMVIGFAEMMKAQQNIHDSKEMLIAPTVKSAALPETIKELHL